MASWFSYICASVLICFHGLRLLDQSTDAIDYTRDEFIDYAALAFLQIPYTEIAATARYNQLLDAGGLGNRWPFSPPRNNMASN